MANIAWFYAHTELSKYLVHMYICVLVTWSCLTLCNPMDCSHPGSSVHGIFQARILEWVAISFSRGSFQPRDQTRVSRIAGRFFTIWATREAVNIDVRCLGWSYSLISHLFSPTILKYSKLLHKFTTYIFKIVKPALSTWYLRDIPRFCELNSTPSEFQSQAAHELLPANGPMWWGLTWWLSLEDSPLVWPKFLNPTAVQDSFHPPFLPSLLHRNQISVVVWGFSQLPLFHFSSFSLTGIFSKKYHVLLTLIWHLILEGPELTQVIICLFIPVCIFLPKWLRPNLTIRLVTYTHTHTHTHTHTLRIKGRKFPFSPVVRTWCFHCWGHRFKIQSLVRELRSWKLWSVAKTRGQNSLATRSALETWRCYIGEIGLWLNQTLRNHEYRRIIEKLNHGQLFLHLCLLLLAIIYLLKLVKK